MTKLEKRKLPTAVSMSLWAVMMVLKYMKLWKFTPYPNLKI